MLNLSSLNPQQRRAVETTTGPLLILAGAGTGKTRVITYRIAHLIAQEVDPNQILAVTFTNKAAREMKERVAQLLGRARKARSHEPRKEPTISTFHSLGARILRQHIDQLGYKRNFVIYDESEQLGVIKKILSRISNKSASADPKEVLACLSRVKSGSSISPGGRNEEAGALAEHIQKAYETALRACNAVDFDDLLLLTLRLFQEHPAVLESWRRRYQYVMVDEYQDTNHIQLDLLKLLTAEHRNLCVVGDDDQSIYSWRGAEISNLLDLEKHFRDLRVIALEQNYRSTNAILAAANAVIRHNARRRGKKLWSDNGPGAKIVLHTYENDQEEARSLVEEIEYARLTRRVSWGEQAILFRTNQQSRALEMALRQGKVRYRVIGSQSYFDRREIRDLLAYLKLFVNPQDDISLLRIANVPARGMSDATMERVLAASQERHCSVYHAMQNPDVQAGFLTRTADSIRTFLDLIARTRQPLQSTGHIFLSHWAEGFLAEIGYFAELRRSEKNPEVAEIRRQSVQDLVASLDQSSTDWPAGETGSTAGDRLQAFLAELTLDRERETEEEKPGDAVTLITVHSCKGLEFPHVYVAGLEDGLLPHARSKVEGTLDEERRLFYVAITRAMRTLTLSYCLGRMKYGQVLPAHPSPFLKELPEELVDHVEGKPRQPVSLEAGASHFSAMRAALEDASAPGKTI